MSKQHNIKNELTQSVIRSFREHLDKHAIKLDPNYNGNEKVWSYKYRANLLARAEDFSKYAKSQGVNRVNGVTSELLNGYLSTKSASCSQYTLDEYRRQLDKLGKLCHQSWKIDKPVSTQQSPRVIKGAQAVISKEDYDKVISYIENKSEKCGSDIAILLQGQTGVRVGDVAYGVYINDKENKLEIHSKHNKVAERAITPEIRQILNLPECKALRVNDRLAFPQADSINKYLHKVEERTGCTERHPMHDIRRYLAQEKWNECRESGLSIQEAVAVVGQWLNHGEDRMDLLVKSYVANLL